MPQQRNGFQAREREEEAIARLANERCELDGCCMALRFCTEACGAGASSSDASAQVCHQQTLSAVNFAISITERAGIEVLPGVNLPMLVKLASHRNRPFVEAVRLAQEAGRNQINIASHMLGTGRLLGAMNTAELRNDGSK